MESREIHFGNFPSHSWSPRRMMPEPCRPIIKRHRVSTRPSPDPTLSLALRCHVAPCHAKRDHFGNSKSFFRSSQSNCETIFRSSLNPIGIFKARLSDSNPTIILVVRLWMKSTGPFLGGIRPHPVGRFFRSSPEASPKRRTAQYIGNRRCSTPCYKNPSGWPCSGDGH
jgi:hypothetical protein